MLSSSVSSSSCHFLWNMLAPRPQSSEPRLATLREMRLSCARTR